MGEAEVQEVSATSDILTHSGAEMLWAVIPYARHTYPLPHHYGVAVLCEAPIEHVGIFEDAVVTSSFGPYARIREAWNAFWSLHASSHRKLLPSPVSTEELLDWDLSMKAPSRPSGIISVTLKYMGRSVPTPDAGDD
jgi:hypothetical protein